jgi:hypothetical protein
LPVARRRLLANMNVTVLKALLPLAETSDARVRAEVLGEIKRMLRAHMEAVKVQIER